MLMLHYAKIPSIRAVMPVIFGLGREHLQVDFGLRIIYLALFKSKYACVPKCFLKDSLRIRVDIPIYD